MTVLNQPLNHIDFHDSAIMAIKHNPHGKEYRFVIELCNFIQANYEENDPEVILGVLVFEDVDYFHVDPPQDIDLSPNKKEAEIIEVVATSNNDSIKSVRVIALIIEYGHQQHRAVVIDIGFNNVTWSVLDKHELES